MAFVQKQVDTGGYSGPSGDLGSLLDAARQPIDDGFEDSELEELLLESLDDGTEDIPITPEFWEAFRAETDAMIAEYQQRKSAA